MGSAQPRGMASNCIVILAFIAWNCIAILAFIAGAAAAEPRSLLSTRHAATKRCDGDFDKLSKGDTCVTTWAKAIKGDVTLHPTQPSVGHAWVVSQMKRHFFSTKKSKKWFGKHTFPVVRSSSDLFLTDRHHHAAAIHLTHDPDIWDLDITFKVIDDFSDLSDDQFWAQMKQNHYNMLIDRPKNDPMALPSGVNVSDIPGGWDLSGFTDNKWRSLASYASHNEHKEERCYFKACTYFVDFEWDYALNFATVKRLWPSPNALESFMQEFEAMGYNQDPSHINRTAWQALAETVLPLCHSDTIKNLRLPAWSPDPTPAGWSTAPVPPDPDCPVATGNEVIV